jgi:hypothetical protein
MNSLYRETKHTNFGYDLHVITIPLCLNFFFYTNFHIIEDKKNKNKGGHLQGTQRTYSRPMRMTSAE